MAWIEHMPDARATRLAVDPAESGVLVEARSTAGRIRFGTNAITGYLEVVEGGDGLLLLDPPPRAELVVSLASLRSGNSLYDAELLQRLDVKRFPEAKLVLDTAAWAEGHYQIGGRLTLHDQARPLSGSVSAERTGGDRWVVTGEQSFDIRDFQIPVPSVLMFRIFPDVRVFLSLSLERERSPRRPPFCGPGAAA